MGTLSRKDFLRLTSLGAVASLLPLNEVKALSFILNPPANSIQTDFEVAVKKAAIAKEHFFKKEYEAAEALYLECIALAPAYIQFYDNLDNVYGARGQFLNSVLLYQNGLYANKSKVAFYDRTARALMRIELGYRTLSEAYKNEISSASLLKDAMDLYNTAISISPLSGYLHIGKDKLQRRMDLHYQNIDYKTNVAYKENKKDLAKVHKNNILSLPVSSFDIFLKRMDTRRRNPLYFKYQIELRQKNMIKHKKFFCIAKFRKYLADQKTSAAIDTVKELFAVDKSDSRSLGLLKKHFYRNKMYYEFISFQQQFASARGDVFSALGLMEAIEVAYKKKECGLSDLAVARTTAEDMLENWKLPEARVVDIVNKLVKVLLLQGEVSTSQLYTERLIEAVEIRSAMYVNKIVYTYAATLCANFKFQEARDLLLLALYNTKITVNPVFDKVELLLNNKISENQPTRQSLYYMLYNTCIQLNDVEKAREVLLEIERINPGDSFASKRK